MELPELSETAETVKQQSKVLCPWLPDPYTCDKCGTLCNAERCYQPNRAAFYPLGKAPCWTCPSCERQFVREE